MYASTNYPSLVQIMAWCRPGTNAKILLIGPLGTNINEISIEFYTFSFKKIHLKMSSGKWRPSCISLTVNPLFVTGVMVASSDILYFMFAMPFMRSLIWIIKWSEVNCYFWYGMAKCHDKTIVHYIGRFQYLWTGNQVSGKNVVTGGTGWCHQRR